MKSPIWLNIHHVLTFHAKQIQEHGGLHGTVDEALLESALARPQQLFNYSEPSIYELATSYAYGITKNHPFVDGNKRTAIVTAGIFLEINGFSIDVPEPEIVQYMQALSEGIMNAEDFSLWLSESCQKKVK